MARPRWQRWGVGAVKLAVAAVVLWFVGRHVARSWEALGRHGKPLRFEPVWLVPAGGLYLAGLACSGVFFHQVLRCSPSPVRLYPALRAYLVSHLGKYAPGKALVVVVRAGLVVPHGARGSTAAVATFYETLTMMAAGGFLAAAGFAATPTESDLTIALDPPASWGAAGRLLTEIPLFGLCAAFGLVLGLAFLAVVLPPVFGRLTRLATTPFGVAGKEASPRFSARLLVSGLLWSAGCWILLGLSQLAVVRAVAPLDALGAVRLAPLAIGGVALATAAGFVVAVLPGGLGVREGVLMAALGPAVGDGVAVAAAVLLRLVWIAAELIAGGALMLIRPRPARQPLPAPSSSPEPTIESAIATAPAAPAAPDGSLDREIEIPPRRGNA